MTAFPTYFPEQCPPADVEPASGVVYRLVKNAPVTEEDFKTHHETSRCKKADPCMRMGLSVLRELKDAVHQRKVLPVLGKYISKASLKSHHGLTKLTGGQRPSHTTWWPYVDVQRAEPFELVEAEQ